MRLLMQLQDTNALELTEHFYLRCFSSVNFHVTILMQLHHVHDTNALEQTEHLQKDSPV